MTSQGLHEDHEGLRGLCLQGIWTHKNLAESDSNSASSSSEDQQQNEESGIDVLEVRIRPFFPYQDEPVTQFAAHMDEDEMDSQTMKTTFLRQLCGPVSLEG